jgi:hypothetical protein
MKILPRISGENKTASQVSVKFLINGKKIDFSHNVSLGFEKKPY